jgi:hypothetical protein
MRLSPLCDAKAFARDLEAEFLRMAKAAAGRSG